MPGEREGEKAFSEVANDVARDLPDGWELVILLEHNAGTVELYDEIGNECDYPSNHTSVRESVEDALAFALDRACFCDDEDTNDAN